MLKTVSSKAAGEEKPEAYPLGYVEDFSEPRTQLETVFSIRLPLALFVARIRTQHPYDPPPTNHLAF
jgi:hypothetical protein